MLKLNAMYKTFKLKNIKILTVILIIFFIFTLFPQKLNTIGLTIAFGGRIVSVVPCVCSGNTLVGVSLPSVLPLVVYNPSSSKVFAYGPPIIPSTYVLGLATLSVPCLQPVPFGCAPIATGPLILFSGTSLPGK